MNKIEFFDSYNWTTLIRDVEKSIKEHNKNGYKVVSVTHSSAVENTNDYDDNDIHYTCMITYIQPNVFKGSN